MTDEEGERRRKYFEEYSGAAATSAISSALLLAKTLSLGRQDSNLCISESDLLNLTPECGLRTCYFEMRKFES